MASISVAFTILSVLLSSVSLATSDPAFDNFLQCLHNHINPSDAISEAIFTPASSSFESVLQAYIKNGRFLTPTTPKPLAIIAAGHESHVQATIICARFHGLQIRIRSGGHDCEGLSYRSNTPAVLLDMFNLRSIDIDIQNETAWVQAGATLGELYYSIANKSKVHAFPAGVCPTIGVGGHVSQGGYGNMLRKYGLSIDNVIDAQIMNANGTILDRETMGEDLFWAIRGGGGASFGVILSWKIKLVSVPEIVTVIHVDRFLEQGATDIVYQWQQVAHNLDNDLFIRAMPQVVNGSRPHEKTVKVSFIGFFLGQMDRLLHLVNESFPLLGLKQNECKELSWIESTIFWADFPYGTSIDVLLNRPSKPVTTFYKTKSDYVRNVIPKEGLESIWKMMLLRDWNMRMEWNPYGGKMNEISETETAFPHRSGYLFKIQYSTSWADEADIDNQINWLRDVYAGMDTYVTKNPREVFMNYRDLDIGSNPSNHTDFKNAEVYGHKFFKNNFQRLTKVKAAVDPDNFFKHEQSIPPYSV